jgi:HEAT repeat protein
MRTAALRALREYGSAQQLEGLASRLAQLPDRLQAQAIALLAAKEVASALPAISKAAEHSDPDVRREALSALGVLGNESTIAVLLARLDEASRQEKEIIAESLARLRGAEVDARMIALAETAPPGHARALIKALVARKASGAVAGLMELARRDDSELADEAVAALGALGSPQECDDLIDLLGDERRAASADAIRRTLVQLSRQLPAEQAQPALAALVTGDDRLAAELMPILSVLGGPSAMRAVRDRTASPNEELRLAAVRALSSWQDPSALQPLIEVAGAAALARERVLALRGFARLLRKAESLSQEERCALLREAIRLAGRPDEKRALLSCASAAPSADVFQWVAECLEESELAGEAALAALDLSRPLYRAHAELVSRVLRRILTSSPNEEIHSRTFQSLCQLGVLANLALKAEADSPDDLAPDHDGQEAHAAIDGNPETYWDEQDNQSAYRLRLRFKQPTMIAAISIVGWGHHNYAPRGFAVVCDNRTVTTIQNATYVDNFLLVAIPATTCTALELAITDYYGRSPAIRELGVYGPLPDEETPQLGWQQTGSALTLLNHGRPVWTFHHGPEEAKPFFHPLALADGTTLTCDGPQDHPWHHGLWFSWKYINGVNYWEEDRETRRSDGRTTVDDVRIETRDTYTARLQLVLRYGPPEGEPVLTEQRLIEISPPDETGRYQLDWTLTFTAGESDVLLDRTPLPEEPDGRAWGGYAGLSARFALGLAERQAVSSEGTVELKDGRHRSRATAMDYSGIIDGHPVGITILDHPRNLNAPSPWYVIQTNVMSYFSPAVLCYGPHMLPAGQSLTLRYRVIVHPGRWDAARLQNECKDFAQSSSE